MKSIRVGFLIAGMFVLASVSQGANVIYWQSGASQTIYDTNGTTPMPVDRTYYVMLVQAANGSTIGFNPSNQSVGSGETLIWYASWADMPNGPGRFALDLYPGDQPSGATGIGGLSNGAYLYTVILNASAPGGGVTAYSVLEGTTPTQVAINTSNGIGTYSAPGNNTWQPIPEPSTVALMVAGLAVVAFGRKTFRK